MNLSALTALLSPSATAVLGRALVNFLWQATLVAALLGLAQPLLRRASARARYGWDCLALFALPLWFGHTLVAGAAGATSAGALAFAVAWNDWFGRHPALLPAIVAAWALGVLLMSAYGLGGWLLLRRARRRAVAVLPPEWTRRLADLRHRMGIAREAALGLSASVAGPCVSGWWRPLILLPLGTLAALPPEQIEALLAHELAHIERCDYLVNLLQRGVETLFFFHPAVWWISRQVAQEREHCCDDRALAACGNDRRQYAGALLALAEAKAAPPQLACAASGGSLSRRVRRVLGAPPPDRRLAHRFAPRSLALGLALGGLALLGVSSSAPARRPAAIAPQAAALRLPARAQTISYRVPVAPPRAEPNPARKEPPRSAPQRRTPRPQAAPVPLAARAAFEAPVTVAFTLATVQSCAPQPELVRLVSPDGYAWMEVRPVMRCVPLLQPVGVWIE